MKYVQLILIVLILSSCNPFISKDLRHKNKCNRKLERITTKCPELLNTVTVIDTIEIIVPKIKIDTFFQVQIDTSMVDSLLIELSNIPEKEAKIKYLIKRVTDVISIDTTIVKDGVSVKLMLDKGILSINVFKPKETITVIDNDTFQQVKPIQLTIMDQIMNFLSKFWWWFILFIISFIIYKLLKNKIL